jgi:hypothetical protein
MQIAAAISASQPAPFKLACPIVRIERALASVEHTLAVAAAIEELRTRGWKYDT